MLGHSIAYIKNKEGYLRKKIIFFYNSKNNYSEGITITLNVTADSPVCSQLPISKSIVYSPMSASFNAVIVKSAVLFSFGSKVSGFSVKLASRSLGVLADSLRLDKGTVGYGAGGEVIN